MEIETNRNDERIIYSFSFEDKKFDIYGDCGSLKNVTIKAMDDSGSIIAADSDGNGYIINNTAWNYMKFVEER